VTAASVKLSLVYNFSEVADHLRKASLLGRMPNGDRTRPEIFGGAN
jgi:hypothetical protein